MSSAIVHIYGDNLCGAVVVDLGKDRVIATSKAFEFMHAWTYNQVNVYIAGTAWEAQNTLLDGAWFTPGEPQPVVEVHKPVQRSHCWKLMHVAARRSGTVPAYDRNCEQLARRGYLTCVHHAAFEEAAQVLFRSLKK